LLAITLALPHSLKQQSHRLLVERKCLFRTPFLVVLHGVFGGLEALPDDGV
jgi:hypothetical protein